MWPKAYALVALSKGGDDGNISPPRYYNTVLQTFPMFKTEIL